MELKVWVENIQRVICGVTEETTCQDVVIALAHAIGRTGRFSLIEKWRESERIVPPGECPLQSLRNWGEYSGDVQFLLKFSGDKVTRNGNSSQTGKSHTDKNKKFLHNFTPHDANFNVMSSSSSNSSSFEQHIVPSNKTVIKRNLTFSGAHHSNFLTPLRAGAHRDINHKHSTPFENSSLDSVEEQSSLSSHSSNSPYSSFQSGSSQVHSYPQRQQNLPYSDPNPTTHQPYSDSPNYTRLNGVVSSHNDSYHGNVYTIPIATSSKSSTPLTSPRDTPTNSYQPGHVLQTFKGGSPERTFVKSNGKQCVEPPTSNGENKGREHLFSRPIKYQKQPPPQVLASSMDMAELRGNIDKMTVSSKNLNVSSQNSSITGQTPQKPPSLLHLLRSNQMTLSKNQKPHNDNTGLSSVTNGPLDLPVESSALFVHSSKTVNESQKSSEPKYSHSKFDSSSSETDENKNSKKVSDLSALLSSTELRNLSREELLRLVNLQIDTLNTYTTKLKSLDTEISGYEKLDAEALKSLQHVKASNIELRSRCEELESELEELELVSWEEKVDLGRHQQDKLQADLDHLQDQLSHLELELASNRQKANRLLGDIEAESKLQAKQTTDSKEKIEKELADIKSQIEQKISDQNRNEEMLKEVAAKLKSTESCIVDKQAAVTQLEHALKEANLEVFKSELHSTDGRDGYHDNSVVSAVTGSVTTGGVAVRVRQDGEMADEQGVPFTRSSSSRSVGSNKMSISSANRLPRKPMTLQEALESEPQGCWV